MTDCVGCILLLAFFSFLLFEINHCCNMSCFIFESLSLLINQSIVCVEQKQEKAVLDAKCKKAGRLVNENSKRLTELRSNESPLVLTARYLSFSFLVSLIFCHTIIFLLLPSTFIYIFYRGCKYEEKIQRNGRPEEARRILST